MIVNRQRLVRVSVRALDEFFARARQALKLSDEAITICFVTDGEMARWNRAYRGKIGPTDVLSFPADGTPAKNKKKKAASTRTPATVSPRRFDASNLREPYLGDIAIAPGVARRNALRLDRTLDDEMRILILHGMLHLMGYDHESDTGQMDRRERRLRRVLGLR